MLTARTTSSAAQHEPLPVRIKDTSVPTRPWTSSHDDETVERFMRSLHEWASVDWAQVYEDLDTVLHGEQEMSHHAAGSFDPGPLRRCADADKVIERLCMALKLLTARAQRDRADEKHPAVAHLINLARALRAQEAPGDPEQLLGLVRRVAAVTVDLIERLEATGTGRGLAEC